LDASKLRPVDVYEGTSDMKILERCRGGNARTWTALLGLLLLVLSIAIARRLSDNGFNYRHVACSPMVEYAAKQVPQLLAISGVVGGVADSDRKRGRDPFVFGVFPEKVSPQTESPGTKGPRDGPDSPDLREEAASAPSGPRFDWDYLGYLGPEYLRVAAFRRNGEVEVAVVGQMVNEAFVLRRIGPRSVELEVAGEEGTRMMTVSLADD
jgi:hypothetical protein